MRYVLVFLLLLAAPVVGQDADIIAQDDDIGILPVRHLGTALAGELRFPPPRSKFPTAVSIALKSDRLSLSDPFGRYGTVRFSDIATGITFAFDTDWWHLDATGQLSKLSFTRRRIDVNGNVFFLHFGKNGIGLELDYQEHTFRRRSETLLDIGLDTAYLGRAFGVGLALRAATPSNTTFRISAIFGQLENYYNSVTVSDMGAVSEPVARDRIPICTVRTTLETGQILHRFRAVIGIRYVRTLDEVSSWTPKDEWSGNVSLDMRVFGGPRSSLLLGVKGQLSSQEFTLVPDRAIGARITWKIR